MQSRTWSDDYVPTFNALSSMTRGSAARSTLSMTATILTAFKKLVDFVISQSPKGAAEPLNPFDISALERSSK